MVVRAEYVVLVSLSFLSSSAASCGGTVIHESAGESGGAPPAGSSPGGSSAGGTNGGGTNAGGVGGSGGAAVDAQSDSSDGAPSECSTDGLCTSGMKCCFGRCFAPAPIVGCSAHGCEPCNEAP